MKSLTRLALIGCLAASSITTCLAAAVPEVRPLPPIDSFAAHSAVQPYVLFTNSGKIESGLAVTRPIVAFQTPPPGPSNLIYSALYVPATHTVAPVLGYRVTTIGDLFKIKGLSPDLFILGGYDVVKSKITGGFVLMFSRPIATNVTASFGPGVATTTDGKPHFAFSGTINIRT